MFQDLFSKLIYVPKTVLQQLSMFSLRFFDCSAAKVHTIESFNLKEVHLQERNMRPGVAFLTGECEVDGTIHLVQSPGESGA